MNDVIGIKLPVGKVSARIAMIIKGETGLSLADIMHRAVSDEFIYTCDYVDDDGLALINRLKRKLAAEGVASRLFEDDEEESSEIFDNMEDLHAHINEDD